MIASPSDSPMLWAKLRALPHIHMVKSQPPVAPNETLFGNRGTAAIESSDEVILEWGGALNKMTGVLMKRGNLDTDTHTHTHTHIGRMPQEDWSSAATSQGKTRSQERGRGQMLSRSLLREHSPAHTLILDFWHPEP